MMEHVDGRGPGAAIHSGWAARCGGGYRAAGRRSLQRNTKELSSTFGEAASGWKRYGCLLLLMRIMTWLKAGWGAGGMMKRVGDDTLPTGEVRGAAAAVPAAGGRGWGEARLQLK